MMVKRLGCFLVGFLVGVFPVGRGMAGSLTPPPGPVTSTMKTLDEVEARIPIRTVPITISQSGSYYLTGDLNVGASQFGILAAAARVTIDLNGYALTGHPSSLVGITANTSEVALTIRNGTITGIGGPGVDVANVAGVHLENLRLIDNQSGGAELGSGAVVSRCDIRGNTGVGLLVGGDSRVTDSTISGNGGHGIEGDGANVQVRGCLVAGNGQSGVVLGTNALVSGCVVSGNALDGISIQTGGVVSGCTVTGQKRSGILALAGYTITGCTVRQNQLDGICTSGGGTIESCTASNNGGDGICSSGGAMVKSCNALANGQDGIEVSNGGLIIDSKAYDNLGDGIKVGTSCRVVNNISSRNGLAAQGAGIRVTGSGNHIEGNVLQTNVFGLSTGAGGNYIIKNTAISNTGVGTPSGGYDFNGFQQFFGPVVPVTGQITSTNPFSNFES